MKIIPKRMTVRQFLKEYERVKRLCELNRRQMETNAIAAKCYEHSLETIAKMCGWEEPKGPCSGCPEDIYEIAIHAVERVLKEAGKM